MAKERKLAAWGLMLLAALIQILWGLTPAASQIVINEIPIPLFIALRWTLSSLLLMVLAYLAGGFAEFEWKSLPRYIFMGVVGIALSSLGTLSALELGGVAHFALMSSISPLVTGVMCWYFLKEKMRKGFPFCLCLSLIGLALLTVEKGGSSSWSVALATLGLIAVATFLESIPFVYSKRKKGGSAKLAFLAVMQLSAGLSFWIFLGNEWELHQLQTDSLMTTLSLLYVSFVSCALCPAILYWLLQFLPGHRLVLFDSLHTLAACFFAVVFFSEKFTFVMAMGGVLIFFAIFFSEFHHPERRKKRKASLLTKKSGSRISRFRHFSAQE